MSKKVMEKKEIAELYIKCLKGECNEEEKAILEKERRNIKVGLTGGVFDLIHLGHIRMLKQAKESVDVLIVVVAREEMIIKKGRKPIHSLEERVELVNSIKFVDLAIPGKENKLETLREVEPDVVFYGYDQKELNIGKEEIKLKPYAKERLKTSLIEKYYD